mmetsp:Transcript_4160/g.11934  ORF Transcript_4160/g.11934 Transcript_4160/m.11934 type:complete len:223 (+) Transcript_4160:198-866(+)
MSETTSYQKADETAPIVTATETTAEATAEIKLQNYLKFSFIVTAILVVGTGVASLALYLDGNNKGIYESKIQQLKALDLQWLYLALVILGCTIQYVNLLPTMYKKGLKGNIRSNPFFFETDDEHKTTVIFKEDGRYGAYNRSNRSVHHMVEGSGGFFASIGPVGYLFPKQMLALVVIFCAGRILHQKGYTTRYGGHAKGFALSVLAIAATEGLALIAFVKAQ